MEDKNLNKLINLLFENWSEWFEYVKTTFKPNRISLREDKLKVLGI
jgi:hypothetical protein